VFCVVNGSAQSISQSINLCVWSLETIETKNAVLISLFISVSCQWPQFRSQNTKAEYFSFIHNTTFAILSKLKPTIKFWCLPCSICRGNQPVDIGQCQLEVYGVKASELLRLCSPDGAQCAQHPSLRAKQPRSKIRSTLIA